jgi:hypothetical protein
MYIAGLGVVKPLSSLPAITIGLGQGFPPFQIPYAHTCTLQRGLEARILGVSLSAKTLESDAMQKRVMAATTSSQGSGGVELSPDTQATAYSTGRQ